MSTLIRKAERKKAKLRLALVGPTGSGKTFSALQLASGLGTKIGLLDTENGSGDLYADSFDYDVITLAAPYTVQKYRDAIKAFEAEGYDVIIIDSLSHAWAGVGGLLDKQGQLEGSGRFKNSFATWREITPEHNRLVEQMLTSPCHIIATMRAKTEYVLEKDEKGRQVPRKIGLSPVQRDGLEYEMTIVMDISENHIATASKDRTGLFDGWADRISKATGGALLEWLNKGRDEAPVTLTDGAVSAYVAMTLKSFETFDNAKDLKDFWLSQKQVNMRAALGIVNGTPEYTQLFGALVELGNALPKPKDDAA